jgi:hypothetical protein
MKTFSKLLTGTAVVAALSLCLSTSAIAGSSYGFSFGVNSGGCSPRYSGGYNYSNSRCAPPVYYYPPPTVYYYAPPPVYYSPPAVVYQPCAPPPTYYYSGGTFIRY